MESGIRLSTLCLLLCLGPGRRMPDPPGGHPGAERGELRGGDALVPGRPQVRETAGREGSRKVAVSAGGVMALSVSVAGFGVDPSLQIDVLSELQLGGSTEGVRQVPGLHNGSKAFLFPGMAAPGPTQLWVPRSVPAPRRAHRPAPAARGLTAPEVPVILSLPDRFSSTLLLAPALFFLFFSPLSHHTPPFFFFLI